MRNPFSLLKNAWKTFDEDQRQKYDRAYLDKGEVPLSLIVLKDNGGKYIDLWEATKTPEGLEYLERLSKKTDPTGEYDDIEVKIIYDNAEPVSA